MKEHLVESPHLAITHLLRAINCCEGQSVGRPGVLQLLREQKYLLERDLAMVRQKMQGLPCALRLQQEVAQYQQIVTGLDSENYHRRQEGSLQCEKVSTMFSTQSTTFLQHQSLKLNQQVSFQMSEARRLEQQYRLLTLEVRKSHQLNQGIVNSYGKTDFYS